MATDHDGKGGSPTGENQEPDGAVLQFSEKDGQIYMQTNIPDDLSRYALWVAGLESMFRKNTMAALRAEAAKSKIITPSMAEGFKLGILK